VAFTEYVMMITFIAINPARLRTTYVPHEMPFNADTHTLKNASRAWDKRGGERKRGCSDGGYRFALSVMIPNLISISFNRSDVSRIPNRRDIT